MHHVASSLFGYIPLRGGKVSCRFRVYIAASVDGFIARTDGAIDWLMTYQPPSPAEDYGYSDFMRETDTVVIGNVESEVGLTSDSPADISVKLSRDGSRNAYVDGGQTIQSFIRAGLIEEMTITRVPILLGKGIPLFGGTEYDVRMEHVQTRSYANGFVQTTYRNLQKGDHDEK
jgi:dihydrofolate reductase